MRFLLIATILTLISIPAQAQDWNYHSTVGLQTYGPGDTVYISVDKDSSKTLYLTIEFRNVGNGVEWKIFNVSDKDLNCIGVSERVFFFPVGNKGAKEMKCFVDIPVGESHLFLDKVRSDSGAVERVMLSKVYFKVGNEETLQSVFVKNGRHGVMVQK